MFTSLPVLPMNFRFVVPNKNEGVHLDGVEKNIAALENAGALGDLYV